MGPDLAVAFHHKPSGHALHTPRAQAAGDLLPQHRAHLIADETIEDASRLLGVHAVEVDGPRLLEALEHRAPGDGVEHHALGVIGVHIQQFGQVPGDRLALAVQVGREPDVAGALGGLAQFRHETLLVAVHLVVRFEGAFLDFHAGNGALDALGVLARKIADVAAAGDHGVALAQEFLQLLGLGGALHDDQLRTAGGGLVGLRGALAGGLGGHRWATTLSPHHRSVKSERVNSPSENRPQATRRPASTTPLRGCGRPRSRTILRRHGIFSARSAAAWRSGVSEP